jgi:FkbM family methyltransferase
MKYLNMSSKFIDILRAYLKAVAPFIYPEPKDSFFPNFDGPVRVLTSETEIAAIFDESIDTLEHNFDVEKLSLVYGLLDDQYSKDYFIWVIIYQLFDVVKIRFPFYYSREFSNFDFYNSLKVNDESIFLNNGKTILNCYSLEKIGWNITLWTRVTSIIVDFINQQYRYRDIVIAMPGDYIIDGGACYGDTSLYFAKLAGSTGRVFAFEFVEENLSVYYKSLNLNPEYKYNIELIQKPLFSCSGAPLQPHIYGAGSSVKPTETQQDNSLLSISIDDFVANRNLKKLDFIKFDIEGTELEALKGAKETIQKFKPKLAICLYHKTEDLWTIPLYIKEILPEYKLYLDHHTVMSYETILFAICKSKP